MTKKKSILVTNDDGLHALGLHKLLGALLKTERYRLCVAAPAREQSGVGHGLTLHEPLYAERVALPGELSGIPGYKVHGTPADCVKLALTNLFRDRAIDLVVSGINSGPNVGMNILYSGTVAGALEACICEIPALALSLDIPASGQWNYDMAAASSAPMIDELLERGVPPWSILNVNFPDRSAYRGIRLTRQGLSGFKENYIEEGMEEHRQRFRLEGQMVYRDQDEEVDCVAMRKGWVSVTPLGLRLWTREHMAELRAWRLFRESFESEV